MSNVIGFLESLGANAALSTQDEAAYARAVSELSVDPAMRQALIERDEASLVRALGGRSNVLSLLVPAEDDEKKDEDDSDEKSPEKKARAA